MFRRLRSLLNLFHVNNRHGQNLFVPEQKRFDVKPRELLTDGFRPVSRPRPFKQSSNVSEMLRTSAGKSARRSPGVSAAAAVKKELMWSERVGMKRRSKRTEAA